MLVLRATETAQPLIYPSIICSHMKDAHLRSKVCNTSPKSQRVHPGFIFAHH
jgi:hypothetical protein